MHRTIEDRQSGGELCTPGNCELTEARVYAKIENILVNKLARLDARIAKMEREEKVESRDRILLKGMRAGFQDMKQTLGL